jgi:predicted DCC family thiol-disulfide oxidoreductase YuxK
MNSHDALPAPDARPDADVVIYDGQCQFCQAQVARLHHWDSHGRLAFVSLHDPTVAEAYPDLTHDELMKQLYVIPQSGDRYGGAAGFQYLSRRLPRLYPLYPILNIPFTLPIWNWAYQQIAKRRYRLAGKNCESDACKVRSTN